MCGLLPITKENNSGQTRKYRNFATSSHPITSNIPAWAGSSWSDGVFFTTFNFVRFYEKKDGNQQTWNMDGGDDLLEKYDELDPRFAQTIAAHGANWNTEIGILNFLPGGAHNVANDKTKHLVSQMGTSRTKSNGSAQLH